MKSLKGTKTLENLSKAFAGESQARNRYTYYGKQAEQEGHIHVAEVFYETAKNERAHAKIFFDFISNDCKNTKIIVNADYPLAIGSTIENLQYGAEGEKEEWGSAYPMFAAIAKEEGFPEVEFAFRKIIEIEKAHEKRYLDLNNLMKNDSLYKRDTKVIWKCINCGFIFEGEEAPNVCPVCKYPKENFEVMYNN